MTRDDLLDRFWRGRVRHVVASADNAAKFSELPSEHTRIVVGGAAPGWRRYEEAYAAPADFAPEGETRASDPFLLYFTSGTTARPKLVLHSHQSYPVGHLLTMYWLGVRPGDIHLNISSPGWAKHAWSCFFAPWNEDPPRRIARRRSRPPQSRQPRRPGNLGGGFPGAAALTSLRSTEGISTPRLLRMLLYRDIAGSSRPGCQISQSRA